MGSLFSSIPKTAEPLQEGQMWTPTGRAFTPFWSSTPPAASSAPEQAGPPQEIAPKLRTIGGNYAPTTDAPLIQSPPPPPGASSRTVAGTSSSSWQPPSTGMEPGSNVTLPTRGINIAEGLPPVGDPYRLDINATSTDRLRYGRARDDTYDQWKREVLDRLPDFDPREISHGGPEYDHPRWAELPSHWSYSDKLKAIRHLRRAGG